MNPAQLLAHFDRMADAPDAVPQLRRFVLDLAVRGKLVEQDPKDEPASDLLKLIQGEIAKRDREPLSLEEVPFKLPPKWAWTRLGDICSKTGSGSTPRGGQAAYQASGVPFLRSQNIYDDGLHLDDVAYIDRDTHERMVGTSVKPADLLLNITGGSMGRCCRVPDTFLEANISQHVAIIRTPVKGVQDFLHRVVLSPYFQAFIFDEQTGAGRGGLPKNKMDRIPVALPPLAEQQRIVARVDELMALCTKLETAQTERESRRDRLVSATLQRLNQPAEDAASFRDHARFALDNLARLTTRPEHIPHLRQTILNLAVTGKLVPQDPKDEPASELIKRIQTEKVRCMNEGTVRKEKPLLSIDENDSPFAIPNSWGWVRIGTCSLVIEYGTSMKSEHAEDGVPVLKMGDIQDGQVILGGQKKVSRQIEDLPQLYLKRFDLLYNRTNSAELVGKTGIYLGEDDAYTFASYLIRIRFLNALTDPVYVNLAMNAPYFRQTQIMPGLQQQCGQANVNGSKLRSMMIPLPPLNEQKRIVARVDELMGLCDRLESQLTTTQTESRRLLEAVLHEALSSSTPDLVIR